MILIVLIIFSTNLFPTPDYQTHERTILLGNNDNCFFYYQFISSESSTKYFIVKQSFTGGQIISKILIRQIDFTLDVSTDQMIWKKEEKIKKEFDLNNYLIENNINLIFSDNLIFTYDFELKSDALYINNKEKSDPLFLSLDSVEIFVPWIRESLEWKEKYHSDIKWNKGEFRVIETYSTKDYIILKVEYGESHPEAKFIQSIIPMKKNK
jgi:hypothetical protein